MGMTPVADSESINPLLTPESYADSAASDSDYNTMVLGIFGYTIRHKNPLTLTQDNTMANHRDT